MINGVVDLSDLVAPVIRPDAETVPIANDFIQKFEYKRGLGRHYLIHAVMNDVAQQKIEKPDFIQSTKGEKSNWHIIRRFYVKDKKSADKLLVMMSDPDNFLLYQKQSTNELCKDALNDALMDRGAHFEYVYQYKGKTLVRLTISGNACAY